MLPFLNPKQFSVSLYLCACALMFSQSLAAQTTQSTGDKLDFGLEGLVIPPLQILGGHTSRTAQLLGEAYRRQEPVVAKRVQYVAELGQVALPDAAPYLLDAMKDSAPEVRAQAARSATELGTASLL